MIDGAFKALVAAVPGAPEVTMTPYTVTADDGTDISLRWYVRGGSGTGAAVVYVHGSGKIGGTLEGFDPLMRHYAQLTGVPFLAVDYRLAPEHQGTTAAEDTFAALLWLRTHADELGVDSSRIAVMGDSGGAICADTAILARNNGIGLARQILIYPMLDDRNTVPDPVLAPTATWTYDNNYTGWAALLGDDLDTDRVSPVAVPARLRDFTGLAPAYIEVGTLDIFRDESISFAQNLLWAGVECELHFHPGAPHGHDWINPDSALNKRVIADRVRVITAL
ncbi:alpha/beta hydrolase [Streptomyces chartreusis]|uniref:alpha/beta hydrolase n=1 Tax=Streptomyces chartreusis TaxID=1969 RepID=UPI00386BFE5F|nr:alpha/beta hydrolase [Streptomyces chartreusis]WTA33473.1 alpha/beta hydrolase [Streptomyces chartreusis]